MAKKVRALFKIESVTKTAYGTEIVNAQADTNNYDKIPAVDRYHDATPFGKLEIYVTNKEAHGAFVPGEYCFLDFTPITADELKAIDKAE